MSSWPDPAQALAQLRDAEYQAACRRHKKHSAVIDTSDTAERFHKAKELAAEQDKARSWRRR